jgi:hypothetical protein
MQCANDNRELRRYTGRGKVDHVGQNLGPLFELAEH